MEEVPGLAASSNFQQCRSPPGSVTSLPFPETSYLVDANIRLLASESDAKRYSVSDASLSQLDTAIRKVFRHVSLAEQVTRTVNVLAEKGTPLEPVMVSVPG